LVVQGFIDLSSYPRSPGNALSESFNQHRAGKIGCSFTDVTLSNCHGLIWFSSRRMACRGKVTVESGIYMQLETDLFLVCDCCRLCKLCIGPACLFDTMLVSCYYSAVIYACLLALSMKLSCCAGGSCADVGSPTCSHLVLEERLVKTVPVDIQGRPVVVRSEVTQSVVSYMFHCCFTSVLSLSSAVVDSMFAAPCPVLSFQSCIPSQD